MEISGIFPVNFRFLITFPVSGNHKHKLEDASKFLYNNTFFITIAKMLLRYHKMSKTLMIYQLVHYGQISVNRKFPISFSVNFHLFGVWTCISNFVLKEINAISSEDAVLIYFGCYILSSCSMINVP